MVVVLGVERVEVEASRVVVVSFETIFRPLGFPDVHHSLTGADSWHNVAQSRSTLEGRALVALVVRGGWVSSRWAFSSPFNASVKSVKRSLSARTGSAFSLYLLKALFVVCSAFRSCTYRLTSSSLLVVEKICCSSSSSVSSSPSVSSGRASVCSSPSASLGALSGPSGVAVLEGVVRVAAGVASAVREVESAEAGVEGGAGASS